MHNAFDKLSAGVYKGTLKSINSAKRLWFILPVMVAQTAHASKLSSLKSGWVTEFAAMISFGLLATAGIGVFIAGVSVISWILAQKRQEPAKWQLYGVIGGACAVIIPVIVLAFAGSLTGEQGDASGTFSELDVKY